MSIPICASSLAWSPSQDSSVISSLKQQGYVGIELAPRRVFNDLAHIGPTLARDYRSFWKSNGLPILSLTSILAGRSDLQLFESGDSRKNLDKHLRAVAELAARLGAQTIVLGEPLQRKRAGTSQLIAREIAVNFFGNLAPYLAGLGITLCIEPAPESQGCDYINYVSEAADLVHSLPGGLGLMCNILNTKAAFEPLDRLLIQYGHELKHVIAEREFLESTEGRMTLTALAAAHYPGVVVIEPFIN